jgi:sigma-B regulation protein RsbU (phosphoserine phosphatase)
MEAGAGYGQARTDFNAEEFQDYLNDILHDWLRTLTTLACALIPIFFVLDYFTMPADLLFRFGLYRLGLALLLAIQLVMVRNTAPSNKSHYHGYLATVTIAAIISLMTVDLGGFDSRYYAGLTLVITGVNLLLPWRALHSAINSSLVIAIYLYLNLTARADFETANLINNLFFLCSTAIIALFINHLRYNQVKNEFELLRELRDTRDALWSEMELAKRIQTALLPGSRRVGGLDLAAVMIPAREVGGDYYDLIETQEGESWIVIGDVSGHGVDAGLVMMMAQTSVRSLVENLPGAGPSRVLTAVNAVLRENISRLGRDHYMTMTALCLKGDRLVFAGKHQDLIVLRRGGEEAELVPTQGTWLGLTDSLEGYLEDSEVELGEGDMVLLYTDGVTEAENPEGEMFGPERLKFTLEDLADRPIPDILENIINQVVDFQAEQSDDITLVLLKKRPRGDES